MIWDASDANPMHRRLPAEVVSRRRAPDKRPKPVEAPSDEVTVDLKSAITLKPEARAKWLSKACSMVEQGKASSTDLYDIVTNRKFSGGLPDRVGRKLAVILRDSMSLFSDKQQRYLNSTESPLPMHLAARGDMDEAAADDEAFKDPPRQGATTALGTAKLQMTTSWSSTGGAGRQQDSTSSWQVAEDEATMRRIKALEEADKLEAATEQKRQRTSEEAKTRKKETDEEDARQRKLEEEADNILGALVPVPADVVAPPIFSKVESKRGRSASAAREQKRKMRDRDGSWTSGGTGLSGSRALLLNPNYTEDLPHLPRNAAQAAVPVASDHRSRSRSRHRRRRDR